MYFTHYEINQKELRKNLRVADKYARMIDSKDVIEGKEFMAAVICKGCNKIPLSMNMTQC